MKIKKKYMTDKIINQISQLDNKYYKNNYSISWYKERYNKKNFVFALYDNKKMIGYICIVGIKKNLYDDIKNGKYNDDYNVDPSLFDYKSNFMYLSSINILEEYRNKKYGSLLMRYAFDKNNNNIIAITISKEGYYLASKYMNYIRNINENVSIFEREEVKNV